MKKIVLLWIALSMALFAADRGELSVYALKGGKPLQSEVSIDDAQKYKSDSDGYVYVPLSVGKHKVELLGRDDKNVMQTYLKKFVYIVAKKQTQLIISLNNDDTVSVTDEELPIAQAEVASEANTTKKALTYGTLKGVIISSETKKPVAGARIFVRGSESEAISDAKGHFKVKMPTGKGAISVISSKFSAQTLKVTISEGKTTQKSIELSPASLEMEEFVVLAPHVSGSVAAIVAEQKNSDTVGNVLGSEQFSKSGDSSVAGALKRVSGITIVGGKYVYVRGLGDRYSTVMLNGLHVPSPEPTKRVVPLDIFPTSVVKSITIQKAFSADIPASFGGGTVLIKSKGIPRAEDGGYASLTAEVKVNSATGKSVVTNSQNKVAIPGSVLAEGENVFGDPYTEQVISTRKLDHQTKTLQPGYKFELAAGKSYKINDDISIGASGVFYVNSESDSNDLVRNKYTYSPSTQRAETDYTSTAADTVFSTSQGMMFNIGADYYKNNKIKYTYFTTTTTKDQTTVSDQKWTDKYKRKTSYIYTEKALSVNQLSGENDLHFDGDSSDGYFDNLKINWAYENAEAKRDQPGSVTYDYFTDTLESNKYYLSPYVYYDYGKLSDKVNNYRFDFALPYTFNSQKNYTKVGFFVYDKSRTSDGRIYGMQVNDSSLDKNIDTIYSENKDALSFVTLYNPTDYYKATQSVNAFYVKQLYSLLNNVDLIFSLRHESSTQQLTDSEKHAPLKNDDFFPSLAMTYRFNADKMQLRLSYAQTISRPDFREFSQSHYLDRTNDNEVFGNPDLQSTYIQHLDLKYEWYMSADEVFSVALFSKDFKNPIEKVLRSAHGDAGSYYETYINAESASSYGVEADLRKRFGFISEALNNFLFATNVAWIQSKIKINRNGGKSKWEKSFIETLTTTDRAMQGQSPYVVNVSFGYDNSETGDSALFLFNQIGERITSLGTDHNKDIYQQPFAKLDFVAKYTISEKEDDDLFGYSLRFKASNLLDSEVKYMQGDKTSTSFKPGRGFSLKFNIKY